MSYAVYGLNGPPFETYAHDYEMAGRDEEWLQLTDLIKTYLRRGGCQFIILIGGYGQGKTYTISRVYQKFTEKSSDFPPVLVTRTIKGSPLRAAEAESSVNLFALDLIFRIFNNLGKEKLCKVLHGLTETELNTVKIRDSKKIFAAIASTDPELIDSAFSVITGTAQSSDIKKIGLGKMIKDSPKILSIFYDFLRIIKSKKYEHMLILLDEFEYMIDIQSNVKVSRILATFRIMFDDIGYIFQNEPKKMASMVFVFAITPGGWGKLGQLEKKAVEGSGGGGVAPFMQRLRADSYVQLKPFSLDDVKQLFRIRLKKHRLPNSPERNVYYPFTEDTIKYIQEKGMNNPRFILQLASLILDDAIKEKLHIINESDAINIINKYPLPSFSSDSTASSASSTKK